jgi:glucoamylase
MPPSISGENNFSEPKIAPGKPGVPPTWAPAAKSAVGCALSGASTLWFTIGRGIVNEIYYPRIDHAALRDMGFVVTGGADFYSEEQSDCASATLMDRPGIPAYRVVNNCKHGRYRIVKEIIVDPRRSVLLQRVEFTPLAGTLADLRLFALLAPRLGDQGEDNSGWIGNYRNRAMLFAERGGHALALASSAPWLRRSAGYVGVSDSRLDLRYHHEMTWQYTEAPHGNVALAGEIDLHACGGKFLLALSLGDCPEAAALNAALSLDRSFDAQREQYVDEWTDWHKPADGLDEFSTDRIAAAASQRMRADRSRPLIEIADGAVAAPLPANDNLFRTSMMVLRVHRSKHFEGGSIASLAVPWGEARHDDDRGGYHLAWARDLVEEALGFLAAGRLSEVRDALHYLKATQETTGGWPQDMWVSGKPQSDGVQLDEAGLPILLAELALRESVISNGDLPTFWPMIRQAAAFIIRSGPQTGQDRWENTPGLSPYTLATEIAALLFAAHVADQMSEAPAAAYFRQTADLWNDLLESWTYVTGTPLAQRVGVDGYYVRIAPSPGMHAILRRGEQPHMEQAHDLPVIDVVSPDALALVRFGLRAPDDPRILNTVKVIDAINRAVTPAGKGWHRYNGDYYGEEKDGAPFTKRNKKAGFGRIWPLLSGERGHYEIAAGNLDEAARCLQTMSGFASQMGLLPEQVWDTLDIPEHALHLGRPSGSAMPLAWAHSEYVRLLRSLRDGKVFDRPEHAWERYVKGHAPSNLALWRFDHWVDSFPSGRRLRIELLAPGIVHFSTDNWKTIQEMPTTETGLGLHQANLPTEKMKGGERLRFTFRWPAAHDKWEGRDFELEVEACAIASPRRPAITVSATHTQNRKSKSNEYQTNSAARAK